MKNFLIALACVSATAGFNDLKAQAQASAGFETKGMVTNVRRPISRPDVVSRRALKDFEKTYRNVTTENWINSKDGLAARFTLNGIQHTIFYNSSGRWSGTIKSYYEEKLSKYIRNVVKSEYYDYSIFYVDEVETVDTQGSPTYIIHMEDKNSIKLVRICDGQMEAWKDYVKNSDSKN